MIEYEANELVPGDEFTINGGGDWRTVQDIEVSATKYDKIMIGRDTDGKRFWLYYDEKVVVK
jgi:hypothetical protein